MGSYAFGDTDAAAAARLQLLAEVFARPSAELLAQEVPREVGLAVDVGCGPAASTRLLAAVTGARRVVGLDQSPRFIQLARAGWRDGTARFECYDLLGDRPPAVWDADLVWARMLLAHVPDVSGAVCRLAGLLVPGGVLVVEDVESIDTTDEVFASYLRAVGRLVASRGATLVAGPLVTAVADPGGARRVRDRVVAHPVPAQQAARLFLLNLEVWSQAPDAVRELDASRLSTLRAGLTDRLTASGVVTWHIRQVVWTRGPGDAMDAAPYLPPRSLIC